MAFAVVRFKVDGSFTEVPCTWLANNNNSCYWPSNSKNPWLLMAKGILPDDSWQKYDITIECFLDTQEKARKKAEYKDNSTSSDDMQRRKKRKRTVFIKKSTDTESEDTDDSSSSTSMPPIKAKKNNPEKSSNKLDSPKMMSDHKVVREWMPSTIVPPIPQFVGKVPPVLNSLNLSSTSNTTAYTLEKIQETCNLIYEYVKSIDKRLAVIESIKTDKTSLKDIEQFLPINTIEALKEFEEIIKDESMQTKLIHLLNSVGGRHTRDSVYRCMRKLFSNNLGTNCSWLGRRNNFRMCDLTCIKILKQTVTTTLNCSESEFETYASEWLRLSRLRLNRETAANNTI